MIVADRHSLRARTERAIAASLRAAFAWTSRHNEPDALRELARMTGILMESHGPGHGPQRPSELVALLHGPLRDIVPGPDEIDTNVGDCALLVNDTVSDEAFSAVCEYSGGIAAWGESGRWLPTWTRMRAEEVENAAFAALVAAGNATKYSQGRRCLIENCAGERDDIAKAWSDLGLPPVTTYISIPPERLYRNGSSSWWWGCPVCRWPMAVEGGIVRCQYRPHRANFQVMFEKSSDTPALVPVGEQPKGQKVPEVRLATDAVCVDSGVWRFIVVPGATELRIIGDLAELGVKLQEWPEMDDRDIDVTAGGETRMLDVKEHHSVRRLLDSLYDHNPAIEVLLPVGHEWQRETIHDRFPHLTTTTEAEIGRWVRHHRKPSNNTR